MADEPETAQFDHGTVSAALVEKAEKELGEKPKWRQRDIEALREIIKKDQGKIRERERERAHALALCKHTCIHVC